MGSAQESSEKTCNKYVSQYVKCPNGVGDGDGFSGRETVSVPLGTIKNAHY